MMRNVSCVFMMLLAIFATMGMAMPGDMEEAGATAMDYRASAGYLNDTLASCSYSATCTASGVKGVCLSISSGCCSGGVVTSNLCPGSSDIRCCTDHPCKTSSGQSGSCMQTSLCSSKGKTSVAGYCTGPSDVQCCVGGSSGGISRDEVINRAQDWVNRKIPYSQSKTTDGYRQDCSGLVSMAWKSSTSGGGHTTYNMQVSRN